MIVVDASAMTEFLLGTPLGIKVEARLFRDDDELHAPHLLDVEVAQALRRLVHAREVSSDRAEEALADLSDFDLRRQLLPEDPAGDDDRHGVANPGLVQVPPGRCRARG